MIIPELQTPWAPTTMTSVEVLSCRAGGCARLSSLPTLEESAVGPETLTRRIAQREGRRIGERREHRPLARPAKAPDPAAVGASPGARWSWTWAFTRGRAA